MNSNYEICDIKVENLYVNPDNARFINADELPDELSTIKEIISLNPEHVINLAKDIASDALNPNELPIVMYNSDVNYFLVMDGNRRMTSIKLMTQYTDKIDRLNFSSSQKRELKSLKCNIKTVRCAVCNDEDYVNYLLEKLHTSKAGISQVKWDPQAQDRHKEKIGITSKRLAIIKMLNHSKFTSPEAKNILNEKGWLSKLKRFMPKKYIENFGIEFDKDNNIILFLDEAEVMKGLSQLAIDLKKEKSDNIAQTEEARKRYLINFPMDKKPNKEKVNDPLIIFDVNKEEFIKTDIPNNGMLKDDNVDNSHKIASENDSRTNQTENKASEETNIISTPPSLSNNKTKENNESNDKKNKEEKLNECENIYSLKSTDKRNTLIPKEENIPIKNQRTLDLYNELKLINVNMYANVVSIAFRSLIEFSINCFLKEKKNKWAYNEKITLFEKLKKTISLLESIKGKKQLESEMPAIYASINSYDLGNEKYDLNSIPILHLLIHNYNYYPNVKELKSLYNNYSPLLMNIWKSL